MSDRASRLIRLDIVAAHSHLLVACSGGPDSTALLYLLADAALEFPLRLTAAYFDHRLRDYAESRSETALVQRHCRRLGVPLVCERAPGGAVVEFARTHRVGIEAAARVYRYRFLERIARSHGCSGIALGHTLDDQMETQIQRFFQGAGPSGLSGMSVARPPYLRPLLSSSKRSLLAYLSHAGITYVSDSTNESEMFLRNRIRRRVLPSIASVFPGYARSLAVLSEKMDFVDEYLRSEATRLIPIVARPNDGEIRFDAAAFRDAHPIIRLYALFAAFDEVAGSTPFVPLRLPYRAIRNLVRGSPDWVEKAGVAVRVAGVEIAARPPGSICVRVSVVFESEKSYLIVVESTGASDIPVGLDVGSVRIRVSGATQGGDVIIPVSGFPVVVRSRRPGDTIRSSGDVVRIKEIVNEWAVPPFERWKVAVVQDRSGIAAVVEPRTNRRVLRAPDRAYDSPGALIALAIHEGTEIGNQL